MLTGADWSNSRLEAGSQQREEGEIKDIPATRTHLSLTEDVWVQKTSFQLQKKQKKTPWSSISFFLVVTKEGSNRCGPDLKAPEENEDTQEVSASLSAAK